MRLTRHTEAETFNRKEMVKALVLFLCRCFSDSPVEVFFRYKVRQADIGYPPERILIGIINADHAILPPESFKWRHHIIEVSFDLMLLVGNAMV